MALYRLNTEHFSVLHIRKTNSELKIFHFQFTVQKYAFLGAGEIVRKNGYYHFGKHANSKRKRT